MHPLAAPGTLWVLSRVGKYLVRPQAGETSHKKQVSYGRQGKGLYYLFSVSQEISPLRRRPGGFPLAPWTPSGPILICVGKTSHEKQTSCRRQEKALPFFFPYRKGFRLCGGDQRAFRSPFGNLRPFAAHGGFHKKQIPCGRQEKSLPGFFLFRGKFRLCGGHQGAFRSPPRPLRENVR